MSYANIDLTEWVNGEGLEKYKKAYSEGRWYGLYAYPIDPVFGDDYLKHRDAFAPDKLLTLEQCKEYASLLDGKTDVVMVFNCVLGSYNYDVKAGMEV